MTAYTVDVNAAKGIRAKKTVANAVDTTTFNATIGVVEIINMDGADALYVSVDGSEPVVAGDNTHVMPAAVGSMRLAVPSSGNPQVKVVSASPVTYSLSWSPN